MDKPTHSAEPTTVPFVILYLDYYLRPGLSEGLVPKRNSTVNLGAS